MIDICNEILLLQKYKEIQKLKEQLALAKECVEFYAEVDNWSLDYNKTIEANKDSVNCSHGIYSSIYDDQDHGGGISLGHITNSIGGLRARQTLLKINNT